VPGRAEGLMAGGTVKGSEAARRGVRELKGRVAGRARRKRH
jgi:hypothetical protein